MEEYKAPSWVYWTVLVGSALASAVLLIWPSTVLALTFLTLPPIAAFLRNVMGDREKLLWVIITLILIAAVAVGLQRDERENREAQSAIVRSFQQVGQQISTDNDQNQARFDATMKEMGATLSTAKHVETLTKQNLENVTGGQSFAYLIPQMGATPIPLSIYNYGANTLTGVLVEIIPPTKGLQEFANAVLDPVEIQVGTLHPGTFGTTGPRLLKGYFIDPHAITTVVQYQIRIYSQNFTVTQNLFFKPGAHHLLYRTLVQKQYVKSKIGDTIYYGYDTLFQNDWSKDD